MKKQTKQDGIAFFGQMTATFTHDLKNILAIINEHAGLLSDITLMLKQGFPPDYERLGRSADKIQALIERADGFIKKMNQFAHVADHAQERVSLAEYVSLLIDLTGRLQAKKSVTIVSAFSDEPVLISTYPFLLLTLIWAYLEKAMEHASPHSTISVSCALHVAEVDVFVRGEYEKKSSYQESLFSGLEHELQARSDWTKDHQYVLTLPLVLTEDNFTQGGDL